jgi:putative peptide zinc metalloprotease protein
MRTDDEYSTSIAPQAQHVRPPRPEEAPTLMLRKLSDVPISNLEKTVVVSRLGELSTIDLDKTLIVPRLTEPPESECEKTQILPGLHRLAARVRRVVPGLAPSPFQVRPWLAPNVQLIGEMKESGFEQRLWLVQAGERYLQLTELLYRVLEAVNGERTLEEIAAQVARETGRSVSANNIHMLIEKRLAPMQLVVGLDGTTASLWRATTPVVNAVGRSPLALTLRVGFISASVVETFARVLQWLFWPPVLIPILALAAAGQFWLFVIHGIGPSITLLFERPLLLALLTVIAIASGVPHEFGHASALRYGGGRARGIGAGFYLDSLVFYTDATDSYRLGRWGRMRTDAGGIYFDLIFVLLCMALYFATGNELLLAVAFLIDLTILEQLWPFLRFDGYWALADLIGVPDFFALMRPVLNSVLPAPLRKRSIAAPALKPWVKAVVLVYTLITVPVLAIFFLLLVGEAPFVLGAYWNSFWVQVRSWGVAWQAGDTLSLVAAGVQMAILAISALALLYAIYSIGRSTFRPLWRWGQSSLRRRVIACLIMLALAALILSFWWPQAAPYIRLAGAACLLAAMALRVSRAALGRLRVAAAAGGRAFYTTLASGERAGDS